MTHDTDTPQGQTAAGPVCCGRRLPGVAGKPLVLACQLCPNSPTYWRKPAPQPEGGPA